MECRIQGPAIYVLACALPTRCRFTEIGRARNQHGLVFEAMLICGARVKAPARYCGSTERLIAGPSLAPS